MSDRYFYHCFPRRARNDKEKVESHGLRVLASIVDHGLLLAPETIYWQESLSDGTASPPDTMCQIRACFTELAPNELSDHAKAFGPFAIEFEIDKLRLCGAIPTIYLPRGAGSIALEGVGSALVSRFGDAIEVITRLDQTMKVAAGLRDQEELVLYLNGAEFRPGCTAGAARQLLGVLTALRQPPRDIANALVALTAFFYPTDDHKFTGLLGYYRQREWRIIADFAKHGAPVASPVTPEQADALLKLDEFFNKEIDTGRGKCRRVDRCWYLRVIDDKHILTYARRILVPQTAQEAAKALVRAIPGGPMVDVLPEN